MLHASSATILHPIDQGWLQNPGGQVQDDNRNEWPGGRRRLRARFDIASCVQTCCRCMITIRIGMPMPSKGHGARGNCSSDCRVCTFNHHHSPQFREVVLPSSCLLIITFLLFQRHRFRLQSAPRFERSKVLTVSIHIDHPWPRLPAALLVFCSCPPRARKTASWCSHAARAHWVLRVLLRQPSASDRLGTACCASRAQAATRRGRVACFLWRLPRA